MSRRGGPRPEPRMPAATSGLATHVQSLTGGAAQPDASTPAKPLTVPVDLLQANPENPRPTEAEIGEMARALEHEGQLQNINIMSRDAFAAQKPYLADQLSDEPYVVINGNRRMAAARKAGLFELRHELHDEWTAEDIDKAVISENEDRLDVNPLHLGQFLARMAERYGSQRKLAAALGKGQAWVSQRIGLTTLHPDLQAAIDKGRIQFALARECTRLASELQPRLASGELPADVAYAWVATLRIKDEEQLERFHAGPPFNTLPRPEPTEASEDDSADDDAEASDKPRPLIIRISERTPAKLASVLRERLSDEEIADLIRWLTEPR